MYITFNLYSTHLLSYQHTDHINTFNVLPCADTIPYYYFFHLPWGYSATFSVSSKLLLLLLSIVYGNLFNQQFYTLALKFINNNNLIKL